MFSSIFRLNRYTTRMMKLRVLFFLLSVCGISCLSDNDTFLYYAYGSNLLSKRLLLHNPSAVYFGTAKLEDYRLDFNMFVKYWNGAVSTIVPHSGREVWGALWEIKTEDMKNLDEQEGVTRGWYFALNVTVTALDGEKLVARTYQETQIPKTDEEVLPMDRRPSNTYLQVITLGAVDSKLPSDYIGSLFKFLSNGKFADNKIRDQLGYPF